MYIYMCMRYMYIYMCMYYMYIYMYICVCIICTHTHARTHTHTHTYIYIWPDSSVGGGAASRSGGPEFKPPPRQYSVGPLDKVLTYILSNLPQ
jgi:hypothetical protein